MELNETSKIGMHASFIDGIFMKENRFFTFKEIANRTKEAPWGEFDLLHPALDQLIQYGKLEHDPAYGYCRKGQKESLRRELSIPKMSRADFDKLTPEAQAEYCRNGGRLQ